MLACWLHARSAATLSPSSSGRWLCLTPALSAPVRAQPMVTKPDRQRRLPPRCSTCTRMNSRANSRKSQFGLSNYSGCENAILLMTLHLGTKAMERAGRRVRQKPAKTIQRPGASVRRFGLLLVQQCARPGPCGRAARLAFFVCEVRFAAGGKSGRSRLQVTLGSVKALN